MDQNVLRLIPKMDQLLASPGLKKALEGLPRAYARQVLQGELEHLRASLIKGEPFPSEEELFSAFQERLEKAKRYRLTPVVNATGIILHTNLGRAPLPEEACAHVAETSGRYSNLEYDLEEGKRGSRMDAVKDLLCRITGAEDALVVNNNAGAVFLMLHTLASGKEVAISRGEMVEIGGSFRVPEIMKASGAGLMEIGTTNKTHLFDYEQAVEAGAEAILKVHNSNFKILGFTEQVSAADLRKLADDRNLPLLYDLGSAFLIPVEHAGITETDLVRHAVRDADVVCFSGDKLAGAGQAGILLGKKSYIEKIRKNQLHRMLRVDKMTLAALESVLRLCIDPAEAKAKIPVLRMITAEPDELKRRAEKLKNVITALSLPLDCEVVPCSDSAGGGSLPGVEFPGWAAAVRTEKMSMALLEQRLREAYVPVVGYVKDGNYLFSVRTVQDSEYDDIAAALHYALQK